MTARAKGLAEFYTVQEIRGFWKQVLEASLERTSVNVIINASAKPDGRSSQGISLATLAEQESFMADCQMAIASKEQTARSGATYTDFSKTMLRA